MNMYRLPGLMLLAFAIAVALPAPAASGPDTQAEPVVIGLTGEFGLKDSFSAQAVELGIRVAMAEINDRGGVLGGRPLVCTYQRPYTPDSHDAMTAGHVLN